MMIRINKSSKSFKNVNAICDYQNSGTSASTLPASNLGESWHYLFEGLILAITEKKNEG